MCGAVLRSDQRDSHYVFSAMQRRNALLIHANFATPAVVTPDQYDWVRSPQAGVERVMLDRIGGEVSRATSIVRYAAESYFPHHVHMGGEEIMVLSGTFSDETGHYPEGWYLRNPPGSHHQPFSAEGAVIFVKLGQMRSEERAHVRINTRCASSWRTMGSREVCWLFESSTEQVSLQRVPPAERILFAGEGGVEILVLAGAAKTHQQFYPLGAWLRLPTGSDETIYAGPDGLTCYIKSGHLAHIGAIF